MPARCVMLHQSFCGSWESAGSQLFQICIIFKCRYRAKEMLNRWSKINHSVSGFCCLFSPKQVSKVGKSHTKLSEKNNVFHLPGQILFMTELGNGAAITQSLFSFTTQATGFLCANSSLHISVPFSGKITLTNCLTYSKRDCFHIWNCQGWIFSPWSFLNHDLCWGCQCYSISSGGCGAPWGKAGAAPAGSSQFQPVPAGSSQFQPGTARSSWFQPVPARHSCFQPDPAASTDEPPQAGAPWKTQVKKGRTWK